MCWVGAMWVDGLSSLKQRPIRSLVSLSACIGAVFAANAVTAFTPFDLRQKLRPGCGNRNSEQHIKRHSRTPVEVRALYRESRTAHKAIEVTSEMQLDSNVIVEDGLG